MDLIGTHLTMKTMLIVELPGTRPLLACFHLVVEKLCKSTSSFFLTLPIAFLSRNSGLVEIPNNLSGRAM